MEAGEQTERSQKFEARALIQSQERSFFLIRMDDWGWQAPGGYIEYSETPEQALNRTLREQLRAEGASIGRPLMIASRISDSGRHHLAAYYPVELATETIYPNSEQIRTYGWYTLDTLPADVGDQLHYILQKVAGR